MGLYEVEVAAVRDVSPNMRRVTVTGPSLAGFLDDGPDQRIKLLLPRPGQDEPVLAAGTDSGEWYQSWLAQPADVRPIMRTYTLRAARPDRCEADVDLLLHGDSGPASAWAGRVRPGNRLAIVGAYAEFYPPEETDWHLLVGDETALPAIGSTLERLPSSARGSVLLEVGSRAEKAYLDEVGVPSGVEVTWVLREGAAPGARLLDALRAASFPAGRPYAWVCGESDAVKVLRRHLVTDRGVDKDDVLFMGYWRLGASIDDN
ncbi:siderophore-interacting protein [Cryptosporangium phraense]|uniref:Siderophore-interacting protein n=2 Tax=Cryptosporangium phraense TaxID=2593070 RepID=A0A545AFC1_9ACTN|nr:siderophore-interacting protein [Cryptosporangium phraense]